MTFMGWLGRKTSNQSKKILKVWADLFIRRTDVDVTSCHLYNIALTQTKARGYKTFFFFFSFFFFFFFFFFFSCSTQLSMKFSLSQEMKYFRFQLSCYFRCCTYILYSCQMKKKKIIIKIFFKTNQRLNVKLRRSWQDGLFSAILILNLSTTL